MDPIPSIRLFGVTIPIPIQQPELNPNPNPKGNNIVAVKAESPVMKIESSTTFAMKMIERSVVAKTVKAESPVMMIESSVVAKTKEKAAEPSLHPLFRSVLQSVGGASKDDDPILIFSRRLFPSDVKRGLARLAMPYSLVLNHQFLTNEEEILLRERDSQGKLKNLRVTVIDPSVKVRFLNLSRWDYQKKPNSEKLGRKRKRARQCSWSYALSGGWNDLVKSNGFCHGDAVQVWAFRTINGGLGLFVDNLDMRSGSDDLVDVVDMLWGKNSSNNV